MWVARYNGPGSTIDEASAIAVDAWGNVYVTGWSTGSGTEYDYATIKYDATGAEQWVARYNGPGNGDDYARAIAVDLLGNVYVTGYSMGVGTYEDYATVKYSAMGIEQWVARYDGPLSFIDAARAIAVDNVGGVYVTGYSDGGNTGIDCATVQYDSTGIEQWVVRYDGPSSWTDITWAMSVNSAGSVCVTGFSWGLMTEHNYLTMMYDSLGTEQWVAVYNGPANGNDAAWAISSDSMSNVYVTGWSEDPSTGDDYATLKYHFSGVQQWVARYDGTGSGADMAWGLTIDNEGNVYVTGYSEGVGTGGDYATLKYDNSGIEQWVVRYDGGAMGEDSAKAITIDSDNNIYVTGYSEGIGTGGDYATVMYDCMGTEQWVARYDGLGDSIDAATAIAIDDMGYVYVTGSSYGGTLTGYDYATIKYSPVGVENSTAVIDWNQINTTIFSGSLHLPEDKKCKVFDVIGRVVDPNLLTSGIYFIELDGVVTQKVVKVR
jgi:hypothetical protein